MMQFLENYGYFTGSVQDRLMCTPDGSTTISTSVVIFLYKPVAEKCVNSHGQCMIKYCTLLIGQHLFLAYTEIVVHTADQFGCSKLYWKFFKSLPLTTQF